MPKFPVEIMTWHSTRRGDISTRRGIPSRCDVALEICYVTILVKRTIAVPSSPKSTSAWEAVDFVPDKNEYSINCYWAPLEVDNYTELCNARLLEQRNISPDVSPATWLSREHAPDSQNGYLVTWHASLFSRDPRIGYVKLAIPCVVHGKLQETRMFHATTTHDPRKHVTRVHCSFLVAPRVDTQVKMKL